LTDQDNYPDKNMTLEN